MRGASPRHCNYCGAEHDFKNMLTIAMMTCPAVIGMVFKCPCEKVDLVLLPVSKILDYYPDILSVEIGLTEDAKKRFLKDLEDYGCY